MSITGIKKFVSGWFVPPNIRKLLLGELKSPALSGDETKLLAQNTAFSNKYKNKRCFIMATGPSINDQPLEKLAKEYCIACSDFYRHESFNAIKPDFYCLAPIHPPFSADDAHKRLEAITKSGTEADFFVALSDRRNGVHIDSFLPSNKIHYVGCETWTSLPEKIDLQKPLPRATSVSIMAIWLAIGMGFDEIYLLGCDHDTLWQWNGGKAAHTTRHFYKGEAVIGNENFDVDSALKAHLSLRQQYHDCVKTADNCGTKIINANPNSFIDIMPRMSLDDCFKHSCAEGK